jgi:hypothetical protein
LPQLIFSTKSLKGEYLELENQCVIDFLTKYLPTLIMRIGPSPNILISTPALIPLKYSSSNAPHNNFENKENQSEHRRIGGYTFSSAMSIFAVPPEYQQAEHERDSR